MTYKECVDQVRNAKYASEVRDALVQAFEHLEKSINVDIPKNCPNCGAAFRGKAECEFCGTSFVWKEV
jgi:Fe-S oxidoreductase